MTPQEIFDTVVDHLMTQGCQAVSASGCLYRGPNGTKCAVGVLIPDEIYDKRMDYPELGGLGTGFNILMKNWDHVLPVWFKDNRSLLTDLQSAVHDDDQFWEHGLTYKMELLKVMAERYGLKLNWKPENE